VGVNAPGVGDSAAIGDAVDQVAHVMPGDAGEQPVLPFRFHVALDDALTGLPRIFEN
jgi:hypothetical protein